MKKQKRSAWSSTKIALVFFAFLAFVVGVSLIIKIITVVRVSQFDNSKRFTLSVSNGKNIEVISINPVSKDLVVFKLSENMSFSEAGRFLEIPIDGYISSDSLDLDQKISSLFFNSLLKLNSTKTNLTIIDLLKLTIITGTIPENSINLIKVGKEGRLTSDNIVGNFVNDFLIEKDHQTIRVINGTDITGLGNRLARLITNMGGNVILVMTEDNPKKKSTITYLNEKTYTIERLQKILGYEVIKETSNTMSDITITIGEDKADSSPF